MHGLHDFGDQDRGNLASFFLYQLRGNLLHFVALSFEETSPSKPRKAANNDTLSLRL